MDLDRATQFNEVHALPDPDPEPWEKLINNCIKIVIFWCWKSALIEYWESGNPISSGQHRKEGAARQQITGKKKTSFYPSLKHAHCHSSKRAQCTLPVPLTSACSTCQREKV